MSEGKNNPIYNAHSYHTKVPHPAIMRYILHYTKPGDIVFDGFAGTGMTGVAASMCGGADSDLQIKIENEAKKLGYGKPEWGARRAVLCDLSPIASFIAYNYNTLCSAKEFSKKARAVLAEVEKECGWMYETTGEDGKKGTINYTVWSDVFVCPTCGSDIVFWDAAVDRSKGEVKKEFYCPSCNALHTKKSVARKMRTVLDKALGKPITQAVTVPVLISYTDSNGKRKEKTPDKADLALIEKINDSDIPYWFPKDEFQKGDKTREFLNKNVNYVHQMYTKRNLWVAAALWNRFEIKDKVILLDFLSRNATKLNRYVVKPRTPTGEVNGPLQGTFYIPSETVEQSIFELLKEKMPKADIIAKNPLSTQSATRVMLPANCVDYIFTDPPFGANIMYSELNFINESWLKVKTNNKDEAIENDTQEKGLFEYLALMQRCFSEFYRILKSGKWMTVEFSNTHSSVWNGIQNAINKAGFVIANVAVLDKKHGGQKAMTYATAVKQDLVISCYKPGVRHKASGEEQASGINQASGIRHQAKPETLTPEAFSPWDFIAEHLERLAFPSFNAEGDKIVVVNERTPKVLYDRLITFFVMRGSPVPLDADEFQEGLASRYVEEDGMVFTQAEIASYFEMKKQHNGAKVDLFVSLIESERDAVQWVQERLSEKPQKYQDLQSGYRAAYATVKKGDEPIELADVLEENFIKNADETWRIPNNEESLDRKIMREKVLAKKWKEYRSQVEKGQVRRLKNVRLEAVRYGFAACYKDKDFAAIKMMGDHISEALLSEDETLLNYYEIAKDKIRGQA